MSTVSSHSRGRLARATRVLTARPTLGVDVVLLVVRVTLAWIFIYYGAGKLFGWFHGPGLARTALFFAGTAHLRPGMFFAVVGGMIEFGGALALVLGLGARLASAALLGDMVVAVATVTGANGINSESLTPGYELNLALGVLALVVVVLGAGRFSVDAVVDARLAGPDT